MNFSVVVVNNGEKIEEEFTTSLALDLNGDGSFDLPFNKKGDKILDVGAGSGWTTALLAQIVGPKGKVWGVEKIPELVEFGKSNLKKYNFSQARILQSKDQLGLPEQAPFDKILVSAAAEEVPHALIDQISLEGTMVIPIQSAIWKIKKIADSKTEVHTFDGFAFVPLIH